MRKMSARLGHMRQEGVGQEDDLLFGLPRIHRVNDKQVRRQFAGLGFAHFTDRDTGIDAGELVVEPGRGLDHLPAVGTVEPGVGGQQSLQQRGAAAHHPDNDGRRGDGLLENLRVPANPFLGAQPHAQAVHDARAQDVHPDNVQVCPRVVIQQHTQRTFEVPRSPVGQRFLALRGGQQGGQVEWARLGVGSCHAIRTSGAG